MKDYDDIRGHKGTASIVSPYSPRRLLWLSLGLVCLCLGTIGIFLPLLPTTSFLLVAAFAFSRSSPQLHRWLLQHKMFGPLIDDWQTHRAISTKAKLASAVSMIVIVILSFWLKLPTWIIGTQIIILGLVSFFLWTRPSPPEI